MLSLLIWTILICLLAAVANWIIGQIPGTPIIVQRVVWVCAVIMIVLMWLGAFGVSGLDPPVPRLVR